jgi:hypothetical protein
LDILARDDRSRLGVPTLEDEKAALHVAARSSTQKLPAHKSEREPVNKRGYSEHPSMPGAQPLMGLDAGVPSMMSGSNTMDPVWQRLWLRCQQHDWQSLAFIGSSKRDPDGVLEIAHGMARLASELGQELTVFDARNLGLKDMGRMLAQIQSITSRGKRCIVVLKLVTENATTVPMAQNVDAALLGVFIGETSVIASSRTVEEVGRPKFLGSVVLNASLAK